MKYLSPMIAVGTAVPFAFEPQNVANRSTEISPVNTYALLLAGPLALLVDQTMDRPDLQSIAILGYN
ncbi:hypothetical protein A9R05_41050 (plasmid) [Burkholderia sp. KK1]|nr:hypothetical protein A9R05_41050 [Burkholderia sp. KK1]